MKRDLDIRICYVVLAAACCQAAIGARYSASGEQIGFALPVATLVVGLAFLVCVARDLRTFAIPVITWGQASFLALAFVSFAGLHRTQLTAGLKEMVQYVEIFVLSWYIFNRLSREDSQKLTPFLAWLCFLLLVLGATGMIGVAPLKLSQAKYHLLTICAFPFFVSYCLGSSRHLAGAAVILTSALIGLTFRHGGMLIAWAIVALFISSKLQKRSTMRWTYAGVVVALAMSAVPQLHNTSPWRALNPNYDDTHMTRLCIEERASFAAPLHYPLGGGPGQYKSVINHLKLYSDLQPHPQDQKVPKDGNNQYLVTLIELGFPATVVLVLTLVVATLRTGRRSTHTHTGNGREDAVLTASLIGLTLGGLFCVVLSRGTGVWLGAFLGLAAREGTAVSIRTRLLRWGLPVAGAAIGLAVQQGVNAPPEPGAPPVSRANQALASLFTARAIATEDTLEVITIDDTGDVVDNTVVRIEAEAAESISGTFRKVQANDTSGNEVLQIPDDSGKGEGEAVFHVDVPEAGRFVFFARVYWLDGCGNSVGYAVADTQGVITSESYKAWHDLEAVRPVDLPAGPVEIRLRNTEDGISIDYLGLRRDQTD